MTGILAKLENLAKEIEEYAQASGEEVETLVDDFVAQIQAKKIAIEAAKNTPQPEPDPAPKAPDAPQAGDPANAVDQAAGGGTSAK